MKVFCKQRNSRMCAICGLDNPFGVRAPFYSMDDGSVMSLFRFAVHHQSYPGRVHGGIITAMLDEMGLRAMWSKHQDETLFGVTMTLTTNFRKPVPYDSDLIARGVLTRETGRFAVIEAEIYAPGGTLLANGELKYLKMGAGAIAADTDIHEEMPYLIADGITEIEL